MQRTSVANSVTVEEKGELEMDLRRAYSLFIESRKSDVTKASYETGIKILTGADPERFLRNAKRSKIATENGLIQWIVDNKTKLSPASMVAYLAALRSLCEFAEIQLNWKKVRGACPKIPRSKDRATAIEEIRRIYDPGDLRLKFAISFFLSSGARLGSINSLKVGDVERLKDRSVALVRIYRGENEEYSTYISKECLRDMDAYLEFRKRSKEEITENSPLFRADFNPAILNHVKPATSAAIKGDLQRAWNRAGLKDRGFKQAHGFRKAFKTRLENAGIKSLFVETLLGHSRGLEGVYYRPDPRSMNPDEQKILEEYERFQSALTISPVGEIEKKLSEIQQGKEAVETQLYVKNKVLEDRIKDLESQREEDHKVMARVLKLLEEEKLSSSGP
jgi:integrase